MTPRDHLRSMSSASDQGILDDRHLYRLAHGLTAGAEFCQRQEMLMRNSVMAVNPQVMVPGQQRVQRIPPQFETQYIDRDIIPSEISIPPEARQIRTGSHLGSALPSNANMLPTRIYPGTGYGFLQSGSDYTLARRQELIQKQNIARMEMNAILQQKEVENAQQKGLLAMNTSFIYPGIQTSSTAFHSRQRPNESQVPSDVYLHRTSFEDLQSSPLLMSANPYPPPSMLQRDRGRRVGRKASNHKNLEYSMSGPKNQLDDKNTSCITKTVDEEKESGGDPELETLLNDSQHVKMDNEFSTTATKSSKEYERDHQKTDDSNKNCGESVVCSSSGRCEKDGNLCTVCDDKYVYPPSESLPAVPYGFLLSGSTVLSPGTHGMCQNSTDASTMEDFRKWTVEAVYNFINSLPGCSSYAQVFKDHAIDGETLPLLTEDHLLDTMGLKLGPALKIRSQVSRRLGNILYMTALPSQSASGNQGGQTSDSMSPAGKSSQGVMFSPLSEDTETSKITEPAVSGSPDMQIDAINLDSTFT
ncbi:sterile alpha motif domain-containing protein 7 [Protopterus annectens]|uniref:sterile alpha motif domain-containing protein 7 n=1 Tax=Protopterus annectens TaxID=7888 RepID=UPI001CFB9E89|nr:sterile alpha motif domain-containing protein 7 [Protopterus annectens]